VVKMYSLLHDPKMSQDSVEQALQSTTDAFIKCIPVVPTYNALEDREISDVEGELIESNLDRVEHACRMCEAADACVKEAETLNNPNMEKVQAHVGDMEKLLEEAWSDSEAALLQYPWSHPPEWTHWESRRADVWYRLSNRVSTTE